VLADTQSPTSGTRRALANFRFEAHYGLKSHAKRDAHMKSKPGSGG
jgi:hypothetical protein